MNKQNFVELYTEELTNYYMGEYGGEFSDSEQLNNSCDSWIKHTSLEDLQDIIFGDLTPTDDGQFIGTEQQFNNSNIN